MQLENPKEFVDSFEQDLVNCLHSVLFLDWHSRSTRYFYIKIVFNNSLFKICDLALVVLVDFYIK